MSNHHHLPQEVRDYIVDHFYDDPETLKRCCLISKSWVPRARKHLFSIVTFKSADYSKWRKTFPDLMNSPAHHTRTLTVDGALGSAEEIWWIQSFSRVERLIVERTPRAEPQPNVLCLAPFYGLGPSLKSLRVHCTVLRHSQVFDLICSLPLLEDLALRASNVDDRSCARLPAPTLSPTLTGILKIFVPEDMEIILCSLHSLQGGLHFRKLQLSWCRVRDLILVEELVVACSDTLECLDVAGRIYAHETGSINLSKATKLKDIVFRCKELSSEWINMTLRTITPKHRSLQQISIHIPCIGDYMYDHSVVNLLRDPLPLQWSDLDRLLVEFWELCSIRSKVVCSRTRRGSATAADWAKYFVPESVERGIFDSVDVDESRGPERENLY